MPSHHKSVCGWVCNAPYLLIPGTTCISQLDRTCRLAVNKKEERERQPPQRHNAMLLLRLLCVGEPATLPAEADKSILNSSQWPRTPHFDKRQSVNWFGGSSRQPKDVGWAKCLYFAGGGRHLLLSQLLWGFWTYNNHHWLFKRFFLKKVLHLHPKTRNLES